MDTQDAQAWSLPSDRGAAGSDRGRTTRAILDRASRKKALGTRSKPRSLSSPGNEDLLKQVKQAQEVAKERSDVTRRTESEVYA